MLYTLYYQKRNGDTVVITRSKSLLKLLKIKFVTYGFDARAFIKAGRAKFDKFDLSIDECTRYNTFEMKVNSGCYFPSYDYRHRARKKNASKHYKGGDLNHDRERKVSGRVF